MRELKHAILLPRSRLPARHMLVRVYGAGTEEATMLKLESPWEVIQRGEIGLLMVL